MKLNMIALACSACVGLVACMPVGHAQSLGGADVFSFVAMGDMPYRLPDDYPKVDRLISEINKLKPAFTLHVGDIKSGSAPCTDEVLKKAFDQLAALEQPLIYSIGDNEWTDCHREKAGKFDPRERLAKVRQIFFAKPDQSLGKAPIPLETQSKAMPKFAKFVENQRWSKNGIAFINVHVVGSNNGFEAHDPAPAAEYFERNAANIAWLDDSFAKAKQAGAIGIVLFFQADPYDIGVRVADEQKVRFRGVHG